MNESNFDDILYDQDIGVEIRIEIPEMKYEEASQIPEETVEKLTEKIQEEPKQKIKYEEASQIPQEESIEETPSVEIKYEKATEIAKVKNHILEENNNRTKKEEISKKDEDLKEIEKENVLYKDSKTKKTEENKVKVEENKKTKNVKLKEKKEKKPKKEKSKSPKPKKKNTKVDNSYTESSTYLIIVSLVILFAAIFLILSGRQREKDSNVIELVGDKTIILNVGDKYEEPGFIAIDFNKGDVTNQVTIENNVNTSEAGIYKVLYIYNKGSINTKITRNVIVQNENEIEFELKGNKTVFSKLNSDFIEDGYTAYYNDVDYSDKVEKFGEIDLNKPGLYKLYYAINIDGKTKALTRNVVIYTGDILDNNSSLAKEVNNYLIDEIHYSNTIDINNVNSQVLLYFAALNCQDDLSIDGVNNCLKKLFKYNVSLKSNTKYEGTNALISYDNKEEKFVIKKLELPRTTRNLYKVILEGDNVYVYEKYAYKVLINNKEICDGKTKAILYSSVDCSVKTGYETCTKACDNCEIIYKRNYNETLYLHTFKKINNKYVWYETKLIKG